MRKHWKKILAAVLVLAALALAARLFRRPDVVETEKTETKVEKVETTVAAEDVDRFMRKTKFRPNGTIAETTESHVQKVSKRRTDSDTQTQQTSDKSRTEKSSSDWTVRAMVGARTPLTALQPSLVVGAGLDTPQLDLGLLRVSAGVAVLVEPQADKPAVTGILSINGSF